MKSRTSRCVIAMTLLAALAIPAGLAAQDNTPQANRPTHHHYKLIDMETFGGPVSSTFPLWLGTLSGRGVTIGWSATSAPKPRKSSPVFMCGGLDGVVAFLTHAFRWNEGVEDLGALPPSDDNCSNALWVNDHGEVVGNSEDGQIDPFFGFKRGRAVLWKDGHITDLGTLGGFEAAAFAINNREQIAGDSTTAITDPYCSFFGLTFGAQLHAFVWQRGQMEDLGTLGGNCSSVGFATADAAGYPINQRGQIVGISTTSSIANLVTGIPPWAPFLWEEGKGMTDLGTLGGVFGGAQGINNRGQVIGQSSIASDPGACNGFPDNGDLNCHAFLWEQGTLTDLTTTSIGGNPNFVTAINDAGDIVGFGAFSNAPSDALLWRNSVATDLGHLTDCYSSAQTVNSNGQVVGFTNSCDGSIYRAFLWEQGSMVDLETLIPSGSSLQLAIAAEINDRGEISGIGVPPGVSLANFVTEGHAFLLIPCDENHPGVEGCDYSLVDATSQTNPASIIQHPSIPTNPARIGLPVLDYPRARRFPGLRALNPGRPAN